MNKQFGQKLARSINSVLHSLGVHLSRFPPTIEASLGFDSMARRLASRAIPIQTVIDIGASNGCWSQKVQRIYPNAEYLLIEANSVHRKDLERFISASTNSRFTLAAAGDRVGTIFFDGSDAFGGAASHEAGGEATAVDCTTVDAEVEKYKLKGPFLLKLDTHGFELPIFEGSVHTLADTHLICVETYNFNLTGKCLRFWEMCRYLEERGFLPLDLFEPMFRLKDGAFWQIDVLFARADRPEFKSNQYD